MAVEPSAERVRSVYAHARWRVLAAPLVPQEQALESRAARDIGQVMGTADADSRYLARRCLLHHRDRLVHEALALRAPKEQLPALLDTVVTLGLGEALECCPAGAVLVGLHYGSYSTLLIWALAREVAAGRLRELTVLMRTGPVGQYQISAQRTGQFEALGLWSPRVRLLDKTGAAPGAILAALQRALVPGAAVLMLPDASVRHRPDSGVPVRVGRAQLLLARGAGVLAARAGAALVPVHVRAHAQQGHAVVVGSPTAVPAGQGPRALGGVMQRLVDETVHVDPSPWEPWLAGAVAQAAPVHA